MKGGFRQSMAWLHTWSGLTMVWLLYAIFLTGALSFYRDEISVWMQPATHDSVAAADSAQRALDRLASAAPDASHWRIDLPSERDPTLRIGWREPGADRGRRGLERQTLDAASGEPLLLRDTRGGDFLYRFHFELYGLDRLWARWIVGIATMVMFVGLLSGIVTHKKIFKDFFTFRPGKGQRSWLDAHNATAVLSLPFHLVITFSGLLLLMTQLMPWPVDAAYAGDRGAYRAELRGGGNRGNAPGRPAADTPPARIESMAPLALMLARAESRWGAQGVGSISVEQPLSSAAVVTLQQRHGDSLLNRGRLAQMSFSGTDGRWLQETVPPAPSAPRAIYNVFTALHLLRFADGTLRALFFVSGLLGSAMVASGALLWTSKRLPQRLKTGGTTIGHRCVEVLNLAAIAGLPLAIAVYFASNRLLPAGMDERSRLEIGAFFLAWLVSLAHATLRPWQAAWREQSLATALLYALLPLFDLPGWIEAGRPPHAVVLGFDLVALLIAAAALAAAFRLSRQARPIAQRTHAATAGERA